MSSTNYIGNNLFYFCLYLFLLFFHHLLSFVHPFFQLSVFFSQVVDDAEFFSDKTFDDWSFDVVTRMDSLEELIEEPIKVSFIEMLYGFFVLDVCCWL